MSDLVSSDSGATSSTVPAGPLTSSAALQPIDRRIYLIAGATFALLMAFSSRYGFDRDELYFLDCARHLSLSFVDQPILTPLVARLSLDLFGVSLTGLRLWPSLAAFGTVVTGGLLAREFGGGRTAQLLGALGVATAPAVLGADHIMGPTAFDLLAWPTSTPSGSSRSLSPSALCSAAAADSSPIASSPLGCSSR